MTSLARSAPAAQRSETALMAPPMRCQVLARSALCHSHATRLVLDEDGR
jgi:hypothetical protein